MHVNGRMTNIIALGHNRRTSKGMNPPEGVGKRLQEVLGVTDLPKWYFYKRKYSIRFERERQNKVVEENKAETNV